MEWILKSESVSDFIQRYHKIFDEMDDDLWDKFDDSTKDLPLYSVYIADILGIELLREKSTEGVVNKKLCYLGKGNLLNELTEYITLGNKEVADLLHFILAMTLCTRGYKIDPVRVFCDKINTESFNLEDNLICLVKSDIIIFDDGVKITV